MAGVMTRVSIDDQQLQRWLRGMADLDMRPMFDEVGAYMVARTDERFENEQGPDGQRWIPSIRAVTEGGVTLTDHGHLRDSVTYIVDGDGNGVSIGSNLVYAAIHQFGGEAGRNQSVHIDQREYLGFDDIDMDEIGMISHDFLRDASERLH